MSVAKRTVMALFSVVMLLPLTCDCRTKVDLLLSISAPTPVIQDCPYR